MNRTISSIMLAGTILPTPFQEALGVPVLCLPIGRLGSMLDAWRRVLGELDPDQDVRLVVKRVPELKEIGALVRAVSAQGAGPAIKVMREPGSWRGVAGLLRDLTSQSNRDDVVLVCEAHSQPPTSLKSLLEAMTADTVGVVGITDRGEPAGVYAFRCSAFESVSSIGYCDLKEQLLPNLHEQGRKVIARRVAERVSRLRDLDSYLTAVRLSLGATSNNGAPSRRLSPMADISPSAMLEGFCIVESGATIEDGVVLHDSVVLSGAVVGGGSVVSRSVIGPRVRIKPRCQVVHEVKPAPQGAVDELLQRLSATTGSTTAA